MIVTDQLRKVYYTDEVATTALDGVNLQVDGGEFVAVMGPSGCGKSTLLNLLGLLDTATGGTYHLAGQDVTHFAERRRARMRKRNIGFVFQSFNLIDDLTVFENVELPLLYLGVPRAERRRRVEEALNELQILHRRNHFPQQLSGGQQQRAAVARAVVAEPQLILADEPTGNLDSAHGQDVMDILESLNRGGTTIIMVTHSAACADRANRVLHLLDGSVVAEEPQRRSPASLSSQ